MRRTKWASALLLWEITVSGCSFPLGVGYWTKEPEAWLRGATNPPRYAQPIWFSRTERTLSSWLGHSGEIGGESFPCCVPGERDTFSAACPKQCKNNCRRMKYRPRRSTEAGECQQGFVRMGKVRSKQQRQDGLGFVLAWTLIHCSANPFPSKSAGLGIFVLNN